MKLHIFALIGLILLCCCLGAEKNADRSVSTIYGHVKIGNGSDLFVPGAEVRVTCVGTRDWASVKSDAKGFYVVNMTCPHGEYVIVDVSSDEVDICILPGDCRPFEGGRNSFSGQISGDGYAIVNLPILNDTKII